MKKLAVIATMSLLLGLGAIPPAGASHGHPKYVQGPSCGDRFVDSDSCSFVYRGGQLYLGGSVGGPEDLAAGAAIRLETRSHITGKRYVLLSCVTAASGACSAGGSFETLEHVERGQRLFCSVEGHGRGDYECGTIKRDR